MCVECLINFSEQSIDGLFVRRWCLPWAETGQQQEKKENNYCSGNYQAPLFHTHGFEILLFLYVRQV
jgi:hypothetical protein